MPKLQLPTSKGVRPLVPDPSTTPTISVDEAAVLLGVGRRLAYQAVEVGEIEVVRIGRRIRVLTRPLLERLQINNN